MIFVKFWLIVFPSSYAVIFIYIYLSLESHYNFKYANIFH